MIKEKINTEDIVGKQFEDLEVIKYLGSFTETYEVSKFPKRKRHAYLCFCHRCGNTKAIRRDVLLENLAKTCGCARRYKKESKLDKMLEENSFELANAVHSNEK